MYLGDFRLGDTFDFGFTTRAFSTGAPITLAGSPAVAAYPGNSTTEITAGITLSVDFDSRTGLNNVRIVASSGNGYATATNYKVVITAGTADSVSVVGEVVAHFSIENRSALMPTTAARTLAVEADGMAHADLKEWLGTAPLALASQLIQATAISLGAGAITTASITDGALTAAKFAAGAFDAVWTVATRTLTSFGTLVADTATAVWGAATRTLTAGDNIVLAKGVGVTGFNDLSQADIRTAVGLAAANLDTQLADLPTNAELAARTLLAAEYATEANQQTILANQTTINTNVLNRATPAQVATELADALGVDTYAEPTGVPPAAAAIATKLGYVYMALRNGLTVDSNTGKLQFLDDGGAAEWEKDFTDAGGVYTESEGNAP